MPKTDYTPTTDARPPAASCTLLVEARVIQARLAGLGESVLVGDADALDVEDLADEAAAIMGRLVEALADARKAAFRYPPSSRPAGTPSVPPPEPWVPSKPAPGPAPAKPSRRGVLASAAGLLALGAVHPAGGASSPAAHADAELIALCAAFDGLERRYLASFDPTSPAYVADDEERDRANDKIKEAQEPLTERICAMRATTPDGVRARVRTLLLWDAEADPAEEAMWSGHETHRRMAMAVFRDLLEGA